MIVRTWRRWVRPDDDDCLVDRRTLVQHVGLAGAVD